MTRCKSFHLKTILKNDRVQVYAEVYFKLDVIWRQIWRVTGRESGSPELLESPRTSPEVSRTSPEVFGDFHGSPLTVELDSNPEVPRKFPRLPRKFPGLARKFPGLPRRSAVSLGSLTPSSDSQKLSLRTQARKSVFFFFGRDASI